VRHTAAKDRTFKTVRPNQGRLTDASRRLELDADDHVPAVRFRDPSPDQNAHPSLQISKSPG